MEPDTIKSTLLTLCTIYFFILVEYTQHNHVEVDHRVALSDPVALDTSVVQEPWYPWASTLGRAHPPSTGASAGPWCPAAPSATDSC